MITGERFARLLLLTPVQGEALERLKAAFSGAAAIEVVSTLEQLLAADIDQHTSLVAFGSGVIVPPAVLDRLSKPAYNVHAASPEFPGRDPHHHAIYRGADVYGATLHIMTASVDAGPIVDVELFPVEADATPEALLARANSAGMALIERQGRALLSAHPLAPRTDTAWGPRKTRRSDFLDHCRISPLMSEEEFQRRRRAFDGGDRYANLTVEVFGHVFRIDRATPVKPTSADHATFTEAGFAALLRQLADGGYAFVRFTDPRPDTRHVLWRHDVDISMHRAARLAAIEAAMGARATYFVNPRSTFYNLLEPANQRLLRDIAALGHEIGLHFDASADDVTHWTLEALERALAREQALVETALGAPVACVSYHNPDLSNLLSFDAPYVGGLVNAYARDLREDYVYCSDSNGYWRFTPMPEVIGAGHPRLHLLTHPGWWTPQPLSPSDRIDRALLGRARFVRADYDGLLRRGKRENRR